MHAPKPDPSNLADVAADILARLRARNPRIHCITNAVAQNFTANLLLAAGAVPSMTVAAEEVGEFVERADSLLVNLGTLDPERRQAADIAIRTATDAGRPWLLDPVFVDRSHRRAAFARMLVARKPSAVRLNGTEFTALADVAPVADAMERYAREQHSVIALTGAVDVVTDGTRVARIENGDPLMGRVTAMGCAGAALASAMLAVEADAWLATAAALLAFAVAGECAAARARGPGSFAMEFIDALACLDRAMLRQRARVA
jgi:hydroxyethylthiazole kinase